MSSILGGGVEGLWSFDTTARAFDRLGNLSIIVVDYKSNQFDFHNSLHVKGPLSNRSLTTLPQLRLAAQKSCGPGRWRLSRWR